MLDKKTQLMAGEPSDMYQATIEMDDGSAAEAMLFPRGWAAYKADQ